MGFLQQAVHNALLELRSRGRVHSRIVAPNKPQLWGIAGTLPQQEVPAAAKEKTAVRAAPARIPPEAIPQVRGVKCTTAKKDGTTYFYHRATGERITEPAGTAAFLERVEQLDRMARAARARAKNKRAARKESAPPSAPPRVKAPERKRVVRATPPQEKPKTRWRHKTHWLHPEPKPGWPKQLKCLACGELRTASHAGDRLHDRCQRHDPLPDHQVVVQ